MNQSEKWNAVINNNSQYDGKFFYAVKSTQIFCRPSCISKPPLLKNIDYFKTAEEAQNAGYRPCKRCRPDLFDYQPTIEFADKIKRTIDSHFLDKTSLGNHLKSLGLSRHRMTEIFQNCYSQTPNEYANNLRIDIAKTKLASTNYSIIEIASFLGFESLAAFYTFFKKHTKISPKNYQKSQQFPTSHIEETYFTYDFTIGKISVASDGHRITSIQFTDTLKNLSQKKSSPITDQAAYQLQEYFQGTRKLFQLPLNPVGTPFQKSVWAALQKIPYGATCSYKHVAESIKNPGASRAVGMANNKNPLLIVTPCHRVVGSDGSLVGYAGSLEIKKQLLELEKFYS